MSILSTIFSDIGKFFKGTGTDIEKFFVAFTKLFKKAPNALQIVNNFTQELAPVITAAVALADPAVEPAVSAVLATVETGLAAVQAAATAAVSGNSLLQNLENFSAEVPALLSGLEIKNPVLKSTVEHIVSLVVGECKVLIPAVESWIKQIQTASANTAATSAS